MLEVLRLFIDCFFRKQVAIQRDDDVRFVLDQQWHA